VRGEGRGRGKRRDMGEWMREILREEVGSEERQRRWGGRRRKEGAGSREGDKGSG